MTFEEFKKKYQTEPWSGRISQWLQDLFTQGGSKEKASDYTEETRLRILWGYLQKHHKSIEDVLGGDAPAAPASPQGLSNPTQAPKTQRSIADIVDAYLGASRPAEYIRAMQGLTVKMLKTYADHLTPDFLRVVSDYGDYEVASAADSILARLPSGKTLTLRPGQAAKVLLQRGVADDAVDVVGKNMLALDFPGGHRFQLDFEKKTAELGTVSDGVFHADRKFTMTDKFIHDLADAYLRRKA